MEHGSDLSPEALGEAMPGRAVRKYTAMLSTESDARAWARAGAPDGALVVADHQSAPRGRAEWPWTVTPGRDLGFSLILRPQLRPEREGWLYTVAASAVADVLGEEATIEWPDEVRVDGARAGVVAVRAALGVAGFEWAVVNVLLVEAQAPRAALVARVVEAIEERCRSSPDAVLADYLPRCQTIGRRVRARLTGPARLQVTGQAVSTREDGALVIEREEGERVGVRPQDLNVLEADVSAGDSAGGSRSSG